MIDELAQRIGEVARQETGVFRKKPEPPMRHAARIAEHLVALGYRFPDCSDRWQVDRFTGAIWQLGREAGENFNEAVARGLISNVGVTLERS